MNYLACILTFWHRAFWLLILMLLIGVLSGCKLFDQATWTAGVKVNPDGSYEATIGKSPLK